MTLVLRTKNLWENKSFVPEKAFASLSLITTFISWFESQGFDPDLALRNTGIARSDLDNLGTRISYVQYRTFLSNALEIWGNEDLGLTYGNGLHFTSFGILGHAALTAPTLLEAAKIFTKYYVLKIRYVHMKLEYEKPELSFSYFSPIPDAFVQRFHIDSAIVSTRKLYLNLDPGVTKSVAKVPYGPGNIAGAYNTTFPEGIMFNADESSITFHDANLDQPSPFANPVSSQLGLRYCELEYEAQTRSGLIEETGRLELIGKVQTMISNNISNPPSTAEVAKALAMSERSLRRAIADYSLSYRQILSDTRAKFAAEKLVTTDAQIAEIARKLGYENAANFSRAFKKWHGESPLTYRRMHRI